ncbi:hypothetical protein HOH87_05945 [bacterium]|nr:hypothetical protein [bacterium]
MAKIDKTDSTCRKALMISVMRAPNKPDDNVLKFFFDRLDGAELKGVLDQYLGDSSRPDADVVRLLLDRLNECSMLNVVDGGMEAYLDRSFDPNSMGSPDFKMLGVYLQKFGNIYAPNSKEYIDRVDTQEGICEVITTCVSTHLSPDDELMMTLFEKVQSPGLVNKMLVDYMTRAPKPSTSTVMLFFLFLTRDEMTSLVDDVLVNNRVKYAPILSCFLAREGIDGAAERLSKYLSGTSFPSPDILRPFQLKLGREEGVLGAVVTDYWVQKVGNGEPLSLMALSDMSSNMSSERRSCVLNQYMVLMGSDNDPNVIQALEGQILIGEDGHNYSHTEWGCESAKNMARYTLLEGPVFYFSFFKKCLEWMSPLAVGDLLIEYLEENNERDAKEVRMLVDLMIEKTPDVSRKPMILSEMSNWRFRPDLTRHLLIGLDAAFVDDVVNEYIELRVSKQQDINFGVLRAVVGFGLESVTFGAENNVTIGNSRSRSIANKKKIQKAVKVGVEEKLKASHIDLGAIYWESRMMDHGDLVAVVAAYSGDDKKDANALAAMVFAGSIKEKGLLTSEDKVSFCLAFITSKSCQRYRDVYQVSACLNSQESESVITMYREIEGDSVNLAVIAMLMATTSDEDCRGLLIQSVSLDHSGLRRNGFRRDLDVDDSDEDFGIKRKPRNPGLKSAGVGDDSEYTTQDNSFDIDRFVRL